VQQGTQTLPPLRVEDGLGPVGPGGCRLEGSHPPLVEGVNGVADRLIVAPQVARNGGAVLALGTGQQHLTAADRIGLGRAEAGFERSPLVRRERSDKEWSLHTF
jgi:hypothetical protein